MIQQADVQDARRLEPRTTPEKAKQQKHKIYCFRKKNGKRAIRDKEERKHLNDSVRYPYTWWLEIITGYHENEIQKQLFISL